MLAALVVLLVLVAIALGAASAWAFLTIRDLAALIGGQRRDFDTLANVLEVKDALVTGIDDRLSKFQTAASQQVMQARNLGLMVDDRLAFYEKRNLNLQKLRRDYDKAIEKIQAEQKAAATPKPAPGAQIAGTIAPKDEATA